MMLGMAGGIDDFAAVPMGVTQEVTQNIAAVPGRPVLAAPAGGSSGGYDERKLARMIRDAILQVAD